VLSKKSLLFAVVATCTFILCNQFIVAVEKTRVIKVGKVKRHKPDSQSVVFNSKHIDLSNLDFNDPQTPKTFTINVIFGKAVVVVDSQTRLKINANPSFFSSVTLPDGTKISSSDNSNAIYEANLKDENGNLLKPEFFINANATFGTIIIVAVE
jgi:hypothetical protein